MDGLKHSLFRYENTDDLALNFIVSLLLDCGFTLESDALRIPLECRNLHLHEKEYIKRYMSIPRSLKGCCRDSLRQHFQGRKIHKFVEQSKLPRSVEDYLLLRPLLKCIPANLLR